MLVKRLRQYLHERGFSTAGLEAMLERMEDRHPDHVRVPLQYLPEYRGNGVLTPYAAYVEVLVRFMRR